MAPIASLKSEGEWPLPDSQPGVGFLSVSWASLDPADPGSGSLGTGLLEGPSVTALRSPRNPPPFSLGESTQGACSPQGLSRIPPLPGSLTWLMGRARSEVLPLYGMRARRGVGEGAGAQSPAAGRARGFTLGRLSVEEADREGAEALARVPSDPRSCRRALLGVSPSADRRCSKLPALRPQLVGKPGPSPACGLPAPKALISVSSLEVWLACEHSLLPETQPREEK